LLAWPSAIAPMSTVRKQFGIPRLDEMVGGGLLAGSTTMLLGASGSGKTPLGAAFLSEGAQQGQPGLHFGFYETPSRLIGKTDQIGLDFGRQVAAGMIEVVWRPPVETTLDRLGHELLTAVSQRQVQRLFIDGLDGFQQAAFYTERLAPFLTALSNELRGRGITTIFTVETGELFDPTIAVPVSDVSAAVDNILVVRTVQRGARLHRLIAIMKMRASRYDTTMREFLLTDRGIEIAESLASAEAILADPSPAPPADPLPR
ncbi:MAG TPA: ATPase domain-containing protein, partial [Ardenticatenaceae bacterium]|nr:ATPase domain-containing protein [Ardenticatenaceae bacterium]